MARTNKKNDRILADMKAQRGFDRQAHFEAGGTVEAWRGKHMVQVDRRKEGARKACRRPPADD
jgi:hypothetical protein